MDEFEQRVEESLSSGGSVYAAAHAACWALDDALSSGTAGTTATVLWIDSHRKAVLGWIGDSAAIRIDMTSKDKGAFEATRIHT